MLRTPPPSEQSDGGFRHTVYTKRRVWEKSVDTEFLGGTVFMGGPKSKKNRKNEFVNFRKNYTEKNDIGFE